MYINYCYVIGEYFSGMKKVELKKYIYIYCFSICHCEFHSRGCASMLCTVCSVLVLFAQLVLLSIIGPRPTT